MTVLTTLKRGAARLACHEIDHLNGILYRNRVKPGTIIPVSAYDQEGQAWQY
jgi:peptide deformylase